MASPKTTSRCRTTLLVVGGETYPDGVPDSVTARPTSRARTARSSGAPRRSTPSSPDGSASSAKTTSAAASGCPSVAELREQHYGQRDMLAMYPTLREDHLRYLQKWGFIRPAFKNNADTFFAFSDLTLLRQVHAELQQGVIVPRGAARSAGVAIGPAGVRFPHRRASRRASSRSSRGAWRTPPAPARCPAPTGGRPLTTAEQYFLMGSLLDDGTPERQEEAAQAYRRALEDDPDLVAALINLANIRYARDELAEAQALYERAILLDPSYFEAHFNLGQHPSRSRPLSRRRALLSRRARAQQRLPRRPLLSRRHAREDGPIRRSPPALARLSDAGARRASGWSSPGNSRTDRASAPRSDYWIRTSADAALCPHAFDRDDPRVDRQAHRHIRRDGSRAADIAVEEIRPPGCGSRLHDERCRSAGLLPLDRCHAGSDRPGRLPGRFRHRVAATLADGKPHFVGEHAAVARRSRPHAREIAAAANGCRRLRSACPPVRCRCRCRLASSRPRRGIRLRRAILRLATRASRWCRPQSRARARCHARSSPRRRHHGRALPPGGGCCRRHPPRRVVSNSQPRRRLTPRTTAALRRSRRL